jgi:hypothetical protein
MTEHPVPRTPDEPPIDLAVLATDDRLLDDLGHGGPAPAGDPVAALLAAWRADLDESGSAPPADADPTRPMPAVSLPDPAAPETGAAKTTEPIGRQRSRTRWIVAVVAADGADPDSPLWPITRVVYPQRADTAAAEHAIARARRAAEQGRYGDAQRLIAEAETLVGRVSDPAQARRLRAELDAVRALMPAATPTTPRPGGTPGPAGSTGSGGPPATAPAAPAPEPTTAGPGQGRPGPGLPLPPILPSMGVPPPPLPLPTPSLPIPLPSLPIIGGR